MVTKRKEYYALINKHFTNDVASAFAPEDTKPYHELIPEVKDLKEMPFGFFKL